MEMITPKKNRLVLGSPGSALPGCTPSTLPWPPCEPNSGDCFGFDDGHVTPVEVDPTPSKAVPRP